MPSEKRKFGDIGEEIAVEFLKKKGYKIIERNFQVKAGEIDIVAKKPDGDMVFFEVKAVKGNDGFAFVRAAQNVHWQKQKRLLKAAQIYLRQKNLSDVSWQVDIINVVLSVAGEFKIEHLENAVWR